jgi:hypothetical protein
MVVIESEAYDVTRHWTLSWRSTDHSASSTIG